MNVELKRTFLDDVDDLTVLLYTTIQHVSPALANTTQVERTLQNCVTPDQIPAETMDHASFVCLCMDYLTAHPFEQTLPEPSRNGTSSRFKRLVGVMEIVRQEQEYEHQQALQREVDQELSTLERVLKRTLQTAAQVAAERVGVSSVLSPDAVVSQYMRALQQDFYRQKGVRVHEDPELMGQLSFRALAVKRGWINRQGTGYVLAKAGRELLPELRDAGITADIFKQYTGAKVTVASAAAAPVGNHAFTGGTPAGSVSDFAGKRIILMDQTSTWAQGYHAVRARALERDSPHPRYEMSTQTGPVTFYRPLTFGENLRARIVHARSHNNNLPETPSWGRWNDSCTAVIYGSDGKFEVQKISRDLLNLAPDFRQPFFQGQYNTVGTDNVNAMEFERRGVKYNEGLTQEEVLRHPFWQFVVDGNESTLREYTQLQWAGKPTDYKGMAVWLRDNSQLGETRALYVDYRNDNSDADGYDNLSNGGCFLRVS